MGLDPYSGGLVLFQTGCILCRIKTTRSITATPRVGSTSSPSPRTQSSRLLSGSNAAPGFWRVRQRLTLNAWAAGLWPQALGRHRSDPLGRRAPTPLTTSSSFTRCAPLNLSFSVAHIIKGALSVSASDNFFTSFWLPRGANLHSTRTTLRLLPDR